MQNRIQRLRVEEERAQKNIEDIRKRAEEIVRAHRAPFCSTPCPHLVLSTPSPPLTAPAAAVRPYLLADNRP